MRILFFSARTLTGEAVMTLLRPKGRSGLVITIKGLRLAAINFSKMLEVKSGVPQKRYFMRLIIIYINNELDPGSFPPEYRWVRDDGVNE